MTVRTARETRRNPAMSSENVVELRPRRALWTPTGYTTEADHEAGQALKRSCLEEPPIWPLIPARHEVVRTGPREPIPAHIRIAVYMRDGNACCRCGAYVRVCPKELDHIVPWSAGGSDRSTNLRTLCARCNQARSNFVDGAPPSRPVTWWCTDCWSPGTRRVASWTDKLGEPGWRSRKPLIRPEECTLVLAYCAFDQAGGYTPWPL